MLSPPLSRRVDHGICAPIVTLELPPEGSREKFVRDIDQAPSRHALAKVADISPNGEAIDALLTNEPGTYFLGHPHTLENFERAFWRLAIADNGSFEQWDLERAKDSNLRADPVSKKTHADYEAPPIDAADDNELLVFVDRKQASLPDSYA